MAVYLHFCGCQSPPMDEVASKTTQNPVFGAFLPPPDARFCGLRLAPRRRCGNLVARPSHNVIVRKIDPCKSPETKSVAISTSANHRIEICRKIDPCKSPGTISVEKSTCATPCAGICRNIDLCNAFSCTSRIFVRLFSHRATAAHCSAAHCSEETGRNSPRPGPAPATILRNI